MYVRILELFLALAVLASTGLAGPLDAQLGRKIRDAAKRAADESLRQVDRKVTETVSCAIDDQECIRGAEAEGRAVEVGDGSGGRTAAGASMDVPGAGAWANYDFVPGERILFADDFTRDNVGDFPRRLEFVAGSMEIVKWQGGNYLRATSKGHFSIRLPETLPERFTIEFEAYLPSWDHGVFLTTSDPAGYLITSIYRIDEYPFSYVQVGNHYHPSGIRGGNGGTVEAPAYPPLSKRLVPVRILVDGSYVKVFFDEQRIVNVPNANLARSGGLHFVLAGDVGPDRPILLGNLRVAAGGRKLYDVLAERGRVATQGILFDSGSDRVRPESTPTLKEIGQMLQEHPQLRIRIEGHTDDVGDAAGNHSLSEQRAAAVRQFLIGTYGVEAGRLESQGLGASKPAGANDTPEGRQQNRRVELVRL